MNKIVFIQAYFKPIYKGISVDVPTGETKTGFFGKQKAVTRKEMQKQQVGWSDCEIDGPRLAEDIAESVSKLNDDGYDILNINSITSGNYYYEYKSKGITSSPRVFSDTEAVSGGGSYGYGYGYSFTEGVLILAHRK